MLSKHLTYWPSWSALYATATKPSLASDQDLPLFSKVQTKTEKQILIVNICPFGLNAANKTVFVDGHSWQWWHPRVQVTLACMLGFIWAQQDLRAWFQNISCSSQNNQMHQLTVQRCWCYCPWFASTLWSVLPSNQNIDNLWLKQTPFAPCSNRPSVMVSSWRLYINCVRIPCLFRKYVLFVLFFRRWTTGQDHGFYHCCPNFAPALSCSDRMIIKQCWMPDDRGVRIAMNVWEPVVLGEIRVSCTNVSCLQLIELDLRAPTSD